MRHTREQSVCRTLWTIGLLLLALPGAAQAGVAAVPAQTQTLTLESKDGRVSPVLPLPSVAAKETLNIICSGPNLDCHNVRATLSTGAALDPSEASASQTNFKLPETIATGAKVEVRLCAATGTAAVCAQQPAIAQVPTGGGGAGGPKPATRDDLRRFCQAVGAAQVAEVAASRGGRSDFTVVLFDASGPCFLSRQFGAEGDPIAIGFVSAEEVSVTLDLDPCSTLAAAPKVLVSADVSGITFQAAEQAVPQVEWFPPLRRCFGTAAGIKVTKGSGQTAATVAYTLKQFERYRATLQIGVAMSDLHQQTFGLRTDDGVKRIIETSAVERGPEYVGTVVLYGLPHYFVRPATQDPRWVVKAPTAAGTPTAFVPGRAPVPRRETYFGRDPVNESGIADRIGLLLGAGISQPGRRFLVGGSLELLTGVNVFLAREFVRRPELEDVALGDAFTGEATTIPTQDHWRQKWTGGLSIDARYALALFGRK